MMSGFAELIESLSAAVWPMIALYVVWRYGKDVSGVIQSARDRKFLLEIGGQKLSMEEANKQQQTLIADLQTNMVAMMKRLDALGIAESQGSTLVSETTPESNRILWVDDNPKNNSYYVEQLQNDGYVVDIALSTKEALSKMMNRNYRLVISDMGREENGEFVGDAGVRLLKQLRENASSTPVVFFCSKRGVQSYGETVFSLGASGITSSTIELRSLFEKLAPRK